MDVGTVFWVYYQQNPDPNVAQFVANNQQDRIVPYFVINSLPIGIRGLVVAGLFAAAMSTLDSLLNALATISLVDFYRNWINPNPSRREETFVARGFMLLWGALITACAAWLIPALGDSMIDISNRIIGFAGGPVLGVFLLGMFSRRASATGVVIGALVSFASLIALFIVGQRNESMRVSFVLYSVIGIVESIVVGYLASLLFPPRDARRADGLLWYDVVWRGWQRESEAVAASPGNAIQPEISVR
jgi:Na+/proline symporter